MWWQLALFLFMNNLLNIEERNELERCEVVIKQGLKTFVEVGQALMLIRDKRLYRAEFGTFEKYCREKWKMGRRHANRLIDSTKVVENINNKVKPKNESQTRPLVQLDKIEQNQVWDTILKKYKSKDITRKIVSEEVISFKADYKNTLKEHYSKYLYFIYDETNQAVKVGVTNNPQKRLETLQCGNCNKLKMIACFEKCAYLEKTIHKALADYKCEGGNEWFCLAGEGDLIINGFIDQLMFNNYAITF